MPVSLAQMTINTASLTIPVGSESVNVAYYPNRVTNEVLTQLDSGAEPMTNTLATLIASWDIYEDMERTRLLPVERIAELGVPFCLALTQAIGRDIRPKNG